MSLTIPHVSAGQLITAAGELNRWIDGILSFVPQAVTSASTGPAPGLHIPGGNGPLTLYLNNAADLDLQGLAAGIDGQFLALASIGVGAVRIHNESSSASAPERINTCVASGTVTLVPHYGRALLVYDGSRTRWRIVTHDQGADVDVPFSAGNFTAGGSGVGPYSWSVALADVEAFSYFLRDRRLRVNWVIQASSVSGGPNRLGIAIPNGFTASRTSYQPCWFIQPGIGPVIGVAYVNIDAPTVILISFVDQSLTFADLTDSTVLTGSIEFEVN